MSGRARAAASMCTTFFRLYDRCDPACFARELAPRPGAGCSPTRQASQACVAGELDRFGGCLRQSWSSRSCWAGSKGYRNALRPRLRPSSFGFRRKCEQPELRVGGCWSWQHVRPKCATHIPQVHCALSVRLEVYAPSASAE